MTFTMQPDRHAAARRRLLICRPATRSVAAVAVLFAVVVQARAQVPQPVKVATAWSHDAVAPGQTVALAVVFDIDEHWHVNAPAALLPPALNFLIPTTVGLPDPPPGVTVGDAQFPAPHTVTVSYTGQPESLPVYEGRTIVHVPVTVAPDAAAGELALVVRVRYQTCDDKQCLRPTNLTLPVTLKVSASGGAATYAELFAGFDFAPPEAPPEALETAPAEAVPVAESPAAGGGAKPPAAVSATTATSVAGVLLLALVGGALLNVMPCVLPVIPIKILGLVQAEPDRARRLLLGAVMALGVLAFWVTLGLVIALVASDQRAISVMFGYWWFNMGLGVFIIVMAVGMCGLFVIQLPRWVYALNPRHDSLSGAFGFGVMTGVLGTPCTGPFLGGAAAAVLAAGPGMAVAIFAAIGLGMAAPYFVLTAWPKLVGKLPRTGPASELTKQVLGLLMIAAGAFFVGVGINALRNDGTQYVYQWYWWAAAGVIVAASAWMVVRTFGITVNAKRRAVFTALGVVMATSSLAFAYDATRPSDIFWVYYTPGRLEQEQREGKVVLLDFTADWCINCKVLERTVLETQPVIDVTSGGGVTAIKVDLTSSDSAGWALLEQHERVAIPLLVVLAPDGSTVFKQEVYTAQQVVDAIERAKRR